MLTSNLGCKSGSRTGFSLPSTLKQANLEGLGSKSGLRKMFLPPTFWNTINTLEILYSFPRTSLTDLTKDLFLHILKKIKLVPTQHRGDAMRKTEIP